MERARHPHLPHLLPRGIHVLAPRRFLVRSSCSKTAQLPLQTVLEILDLHLRKDSLNLVQISWPRTSQPDAALERTKSDYGAKVKYYMVYVANGERVIKVIKEIQNNLALWILRTCCISRCLVVKVLLIVCVSINAAGYMISELLLTTLDRTLAILELFLATDPVKSTGSSLVDQSRADAMVHQRQG